MSADTYSTITFAVDKETAVLTIDRPPMNILNIPTMTEINRALTSLRGRSDVKILVLKGSGDKAFSAGVDVADHTEDKAEHMLDVFHDIFRNLVELDQVTVAAVKGLTLGGGCEVALFCDLIFAADNLKIGQPEIKLSVLPPVALLVLPRLIGLRRANDLLLSGRIVDAAEADRIGLVNKVVPLETFDGELERYLQPFLELSLVGLKYSKKGLRIALETSFSDGLTRMEKIYHEELMATADAHEGLKAFLEKRKPVWTNK